MRILGYKYDDENNKFIINEEEATVVKCIFDLSTSYQLRNDEIENLIKGIESLYEIIEERINDIWNKLYEKNENIAEKFDVSNMIIMLDKDKNTVVSILEQMAIEINQSSGEIDKELLKKIDNVIILIKDIEKINDKYGNFENISNIYNQYLRDKFGVKVIQHEAIVSKELWEEISKRTIIKEEDEEIDITE